jgi:hypothetical protein
VSSALLGLVVQTDGRQTTQRPDSGNGALPGALLARELLRMGELKEHQELRLFVLEHRLLGRDARLEIEHGLLVSSRANRPDELFERVKALARALERLAARSAASNVAQSAGR